MHQKQRFSLVLFFLVLSLLIGACGTPTSTSSKIAPSLDTPSPTSTPAQAWKTYHSSFFTLQYPASWAAPVVVPPPFKGFYMQKVAFSPSAKSPISFTVTINSDGERATDTLLYNDPLYRSCNIESVHKVVIDKMTWLTALGEIKKGTQFLPAKVEIAYASHIYPYRITFGTPPEQFASNAETLNTMFNSFQEK